jgi:8-oxo-dGTP pyrophosphatase MutT (NUDIX family)
MKNLQMNLSQLQRTKVKQFERRKTHTKWQKPTKLSLTLLGSPNFTGSKLVNKNHLQKCRWFLFCVILQCMSYLSIGLRKFIYNRRGVVFIILRPDNTSLLQLRDGNSRRFPHRWCWPGGACDSGESFVDTTIREIKEEYELLVEKENITLLMSKYFGQQKIFICKVSQDVLPVMHEGADMKWMGVDEIESISLGYNQADVLRNFRKYLQNISL